MSTVFHKNHQAISRNARWRLDARSPDNDNDTFGAPFASNFLLSLTNAATGAVAWSKSVPPPDGLAVSNDGYSVYFVSGRGGSSNALCFSPKGPIGNWISIVAGDDGPPSPHRFVAEFAQASLSLFLWRNPSHSYFFSHEGPKFASLLPWGDRFLVDLDTCCLLPPPFPSAS